MPTYGDETLHDRYAREHADHMARLAKMTPEQIAEMELSLHNALAEVDRLRAKASQGGEAVAWQIRSMTNHPDSKWTSWRECGELERAMHSAEAGKFNRHGILREFRPLYTNPADQVAEGVGVSRELLERIAGKSCDPDCCIAYWRDELRQLLAKSEGVKP